MRSHCFTDCAFPQADQTTSVSISGMSPGDIATYTCAQGYSNLVGETYRACQEDASWTNSPPTCSITSMSDFII